MLSKEASVCGIGFLKNVLKDYIRTYRLLLYNDDHHCAVIPKHEGSEAYNINDIIPIDLLKPYLLINVFNKRSSYINDRRIPHWQGGLLVGST